MTPVQVESSEAIPATKNEEEEEEIDIDLNDPEVASAAVKIQAGFRARINAKKTDTAKVFAPYQFMHAHIKNGEKKQNKPKNYIKYTDFFSCIIEIWLYQKLIKIINQGTPGV